MPGHPFRHLLAMIKSEAVAVLLGLQSGQLHEKAGPRGWTMGSPKPSPSRAHNFSSILATPHGPAVLERLPTNGFPDFSE